MRMRDRWVAHVAALVMAAAIPLVGPVQVLARETAAPAAPAPPIVEIVDWGPFSPNGDGRGDLARVRFDLRAAAHLDIRVNLGGGVSLRNDLGRLDAGQHVWTWDGRGPDGGVVGDSTYEVQVRATRGDVTSRDLVYLDLVTEADGELITTRRVVHPRASIVHDRMQLMFVKGGRLPEEDDVAQSRSRLRILDERGRIVAEQRAAHAYTPWFGWDGRDSDGDPLPAGPYVARLRTVDEAGNMLRLVKRVRVSDADLVEQMWTATVPAAEVATYEPYFDGCNGCADFCDPVASDRFAGGLSFRPCVDQWLWGPARHFTADVPFAAAPVDRYRIAVTGGPTTVEGAGTGRLVLGERKLTLVPGEGTTTSPWLGVDLARQPNLPTGTRPMVWSFSTGEGSYDVASFTIDYLHYVPVP